MRGRGLTGADVLTAQRMWNEGAPAEDIARACSCTVGSVYATARRCGFPARARRPAGGLRLAADPTPLEIAADCIRLRVLDIAERRRGE